MSTNTESLMKEPATPTRSKSEVRKTMQDESGWLIEMKFGDGLLWWSGEFEPADAAEWRRARLIARMVNDAGKAVRFARREDAQRVLDAMLAARPCPILVNAPTLYSVQEHLWPAPQAAEPVAVSDAEINAVISAQQFWRIAARESGFSFAPELHDFARAVLALAPQEAQAQPHSATAWRHMLVGGFVAKWSGNNTVKAGDVLDWIMGLPIERA